jgi:hypothetical protein
MWDYISRGSDVMGLTTVVGRGSDVLNSSSYATLNKFTPAKKHFHSKTKYIALIHKNLLIFLHSPRFAIRIFPTVLEV